MSRRAAERCRGRSPTWSRTLLRRTLIADHVTAGPCFGGRHDAITVEGALDAGARRLGWDFALVGPGPGILGSASALGHGGLAALSSAHAALALGCRVVLAPRLSSADRRERHRGLSHHTATVLELLLRPVEVAVPASDGEGTAALRAALGSGGHEAVEVDVEELLGDYVQSGLPADDDGAFATRTVSSSSPGWPAERRSHERKEEPR